MKKYNAEAEEIISLEDSEILHVSNFHPGHWSGYKKFYVYRIIKRTGLTRVSKPFISDLDAFRIEMKRRGVAMRID